MLPIFMVDRNTRLTPASGVVLFVFIFIKKLVALNFKAPRALFFGSIPIKFPMPCIVLATSEYLKIFYGIIKRVFVDVMNYLVSGKSPTNGLLNQMPMLVDRLSVYTDHLVAPIVHKAICITRMSALLVEKPLPTLSSAKRLWPVCSKITNAKAYRTGFTGYFFTANTHLDMITLARYDGQYTMEL